jgi:hypothetical protein
MAEEKKYNLALLILVGILIILVIFVWIADIPTLNPPIPEEEKSFEKCIEENEVILYGRENSEVFKSQKEDLGELFEFIPVIDCSKEIEKCKGILLTPAWKIKGQVFYSYLDKDILIKLLECE